MMIDWNLCVSVVTAATAVAAIVLTAQQTRLNNKQHLFDRRLKNYKIAVGLLSLCKQNYTHIDSIISASENEPFFHIDLLFMFLTNNSYMEKQSYAIKHLLEEPSHKDFLGKLEEIRDISTEMDLIFNCEVSAKKMGAFLMAYSNALMGMFKYQIIIDKMNSANKDKPMTVEEAGKLFRESENRMELISAFKELQEKYNAASQLEVDTELRKQIALK